MTGPDAVDYSFSRPTSPQALVAAGIKLVARYLSTPPNTKNLTAPEAQGLLAAGVAILLNWESDRGRPLLGAEAGSADGLAAANYAESIGVPHGLTIYFSCDEDTSSPQWPTVTAYYKAALAAMAGRYLIGVYGEADVLDMLHNAGAISSGWQAAAWSGGRLSANADLYQYLNTQTLAGASVDFDRIIHPELLGAWWPNGLAPAGSTSQAEDDDMLSDDEKHRLLQSADLLNFLESTGLVSSMFNNDGDTRTRIGLLQYQATAMSAALAGALNAISALSVQVSAITAQPAAAPVDLDAIKSAIADALAQVNLVLTLGKVAA